MNFWVGSVCKRNSGFSGGLRRKVREFQKSWKRKIEMKEKGIFIGSSQEDKSVSFLFEFQNKTNQLRLRAMMRIQRNPGERTEDLVI